MRNFFAPTVCFIALSLSACGGSEPAPAPDPTPAPAPEPEPEPEPEVDFASLSDEAKMAKLMELGENVYTTGGSGGVACSTCHQANGLGLPGSFPPLAGSLEVMGDCKTHAGFVINGQSGEITVQGVTYNGVMPAQGTLSDLEIAAVITYERNSWDNAGGMCSPDDVAGAR